MKHVLLILPAIFCHDLCDKRGYDMGFYVPKDKGHCWCADRVAKDSSIEMIFNARWAPWALPKEAEAEASFR